MVADLTARLLIFIVLADYNMLCMACPTLFLGQLFHCGLHSKFSRLLICYLVINKAILLN